MTCVAGVQLTSSHVEVKRADDDKRRAVTSQIRPFASDDVIMYEVVVHELESNMEQVVYIFTENAHGRSASSHSVEVHTESEETLLHIYNQTFAK